MIYFIILAKICIRLFDKNVFASQVALELYDISSSVIHTSRFIQTVSQAQTYSWPNYGQPVCA